MRRTMLFLPGNNPNMIANGGILGSDSIILDLEDAVAPDQKDAARELVKNALVAVDFGKCEIIIRINGLDTPYWEEDLEELIPLKPDAIMPPKVSSGDYIRQLDEKITQVEQKNGMKPGTTKLIALLETAQGIENAYEIACASERMTAMFLGAEDLTADLRCARTKEGGEIAYARGRIVCAARAAGIEVYDTPFTDVNDDEGIRIWKAWRRMPGWPRDWALPERLPFLPGMWTASTGCSVPPKRKFSMLWMCLRLLNRRRPWARAPFPCGGR